MVPLKNLEREEGDELPYESHVFPQNLSSFGHFAIFRIIKRETGTISSGLRGQNYLEEVLNTIFLPMPANLATAYNAGYQNEELGQLGKLAVTTAADMRRGADTGTTAFTGSLASIGEKIISVVTTKEGIGALAEGAAAAGVQQLGGGVVKAAAADFAGVAPNPHRVMLFTGVDFREHQFQYKLSPRNQQESETITKIITLMKKYMLPSFGQGSSRAFFNYPEIFEIDFRNKQHLFEIQPSVLKSFTVQYHPLGYAAYTRTETSIAPVEIEINMTFQEIEILTRESIEDEEQYQKIG